MKKNDEMIRKTVEEFGDKTPAFAKHAGKFVERAITECEKGYDESNRKRLCTALADMSVWYDALMLYYGIEWSEIEELIKQPELDKTIRSIV